MKKAENLLTKIKLNGVNRLKNECQKQANKKNELQTKLLSLSSKKSNLGSSNRKIGKENTKLVQKIEQEEEKMQVFA